MAIAGLSATRKVIWSESYQSSSTLVEGAVVVYGATQDLVALPAGAAAAAVAGVVTDSGGAVSGDRVNVQKLGKALVLLAAGATVALGDPLIVANSSGHVKTRTSETACVVVGFAEQAFTAGSNADPLMCTLALMYLE